MQDVIHHDRRRKTKQKYSRRRERNLQKCKFALDVLISKHPLLDLFHSIGSVNIMSFHLEMGLTKSYVRMAKAWGLGAIASVTSLNSES